MNNLGMRAKLRELAGDAVIETCANGEEHVALMHAHIGFVSPVHAQHPDKLMITRGKGTQPH